MNELVVYMVFRTDLKMSPGKIAAQAGHAIQRLIRKIEIGPSDVHRENLRRWEQGSYTKIALGISSERALVELAGGWSETPTVVITDEGRTEIASGSITCLAVGPVEKRSLNSLNALRLL